MLGGIRSGKSRLAETLLGDLSGDLRYVATGAPADRDPEWAARVDAHRGRRGERWQTVESADVAGVLSGADPVPTLVDDVGGWLTAAYDGRGWAGDVSPDIESLVAAVDRYPAPLVLVSPEVGLTLVPATASGRLFADALGTANQRLAAVCERVLLVVAGVPVRIKGA
ncbi:hypothetical protein MBRU_16585 [Mycolicibacterium brumae DSM 44177]|nr:hypothetical protein MBRU_16585 [Mycolicibacterium brumae DSM 44177]